VWGGAAAAAAARPRASAGGATSPERALRVPTQVGRFSFSSDTALDGHLGARVQMILARRGCARERPQGAIQHRRRQQPTSK